MPAGHVRAGGGDTEEVLAAGAGVAALEPGPCFMLDAVEKHHDRVRIVHHLLVRRLQLAGRVRGGIEVEILLGDQHLDVGIVVGDGLAQILVPPAHGRREAVGGQIDLHRVLDAVHRDRGLHLRLGAGLPLRGDGERLLQAEALVDQRLADDDPVDVRQVAQPGHVVEAVHGAARIHRDDHVLLHLHGQRQRGRGIALEPVDVEVDDAGDPRHLEVVDDVAGPVGGLRPPAVDHHVAVLGRDVGEDRGRVPGAGLGQQLLVGDGQRAEDHVGRARLEP